MLLQIKKEQDVLEKQLWEERGRIQSKYDEKVKYARTRSVNALSLLDG